MTVAFKCIKHSHQLMRLVLSFRLSSELNHLSPSCLSVIYIHFLKVDKLLSTVFLTALHIRNWNWVIIQQQDAAREQQELFTK